MSKPDDVFEEASTSMKDYVDNVVPMKKQKKRRRKNRLIMIIVVVLLAVGAAVWYFVIRKPAPANQSPSSQTAEQQQSEPAAEVVTTTEHYVSQAFNLSLDYPSNWKVDDTDAAQLQVISPQTKLKDASGADVNGKVIVTVRGKGSALSELTGEITATRASEKMSYTQPSSQQRGQTYLTFVRYAGPGLDGVFITGDNGYEKDAVVPKKDLSLGDPIVNVSFVSCKDNACDTKTAKPLSLTDSEWEDNAFLKQAKTLLQSLVIS